MRFALMTMIVSCAISTSVKAQQWQSVASVDTRFGYSTNSYLNPFLADWNSAAESAYNFTSAIFQSNWHQNNSSISVTGGLLFEPVFRQNENWKGGLAMGNYTYRFSNDWSAGFEAGASYFSGSYHRSIAWIQPKVTWFVSPFTLLRLEAGTNFQNYENYLESQSGNNRFDLYGLEFESWPGYRWQFSAGLYGSLHTLPSIQKGFNTRTKASYYFGDGSSISFSVGLEQYQNQTETEQGGGGPPIDIPPQNQQTTLTLNTDRIYRAGVEGAYPINKHFSVFTSAEILRFESTTSDVATNDYKISGGLRFSFEPGIGKSQKNVTPSWQVNNDQQQIRVRFSGEGRLYLVGEFNNWNKSGIPLRNQSEDNYVAQLQLSPGAYEYKILHVQGDSEEWLRFSDKTYTVDDGFGSRNAILLVE